LAVAAGLHLAAFPQHLREGAGVATFFLATAVLQLGAAAFVQLRDPDRRAQLLIAAGNIALITLWAASRSVGVAGAGHGGGPEPVGLLDVLAVAAEAAAVVGLVARPGSAARTSPTVAWPALALVALLVGGAALRWAPTTHAAHVHRSPSPPAEAHEHSAVETVGVVDAVEPVVAPVVEPVVPADAPDVAGDHRHGHGEHTHGEYSHDRGDR
jgi:hypothetical protein